MEIAKALVLTGSPSGARQWSGALGGPKHLVPVANRPILFHNLEGLRAAGLIEATIAVDPREALATEHAVGDGSDWNLAIRYADCVPVVGLASALAASRDHLGDEPILVQHGDALLHDRIQPHIRAFAQEGLDALALELPQPVASGHDATAAYLLSARATSMLLERPEVCGDPIAAVRELGGSVRLQRVHGSLPCHGDQQALLESNRHLLSRVSANVDGVFLADCEIQGEVVIHPSARLERSIVRGPAIIGPDCRLTDAYVGPYTSIGAGVTIEGSEVEHSIVMDDAELRFIGTRLDSSVIGRGARVVRAFRMPSSMQLSLGDGAQIALP